MNGSGQPKAGVGPDYRAARRLTVAGRGNLGRSLARALDARLVPARVGFRLPHSGVLFVAVPDGAVRDMAVRIAEMQPSRALAVVHCSGALGLDVLDVLAENPRGSFHPLQSFPAPRDPSAFRGITVAIDATTPALERRLGTIARSLGGRPRHVGDGERVVYHAAAVFASNFVDVVVAEAVALLQRIGWSEKESRDALMPLVDGAVSNIRSRGPIKALTGPIRRGDAETVARHLAVMDNRDLYRMLALVALEIAQQAGLEPAAVERTRRALTRNVAATQRRRGR